MKKNLLLFCFVCLSPFFLGAQVADTLGVMTYGEPKDFEIGGITVLGANFSDDNAIIGVTGLKIGENLRIPGPEIPKAIKALWKLRLFTDVKIIQEKVIGDVIFLEVHLQERPRLSRHTYRGTKKSYHDDLNDEVNRFLLKGGIVTENIKVNSAEAIQNFFINKGFLDVKVDVLEEKDTARINSVLLVFDIDRGSRVKIDDITFTGNSSVTAKKLRKQMKNTRRKRKIFASSKLIKDDFETDKNQLIAYYNKLGYRDAQIEADSIWRNDDGLLMINLDIEEGSQYYFRNIAWKGNTIYTTEALQSILGINSGDIYNQELLETRLRFSQDGRDVSTQYMDNGYLFFQVDPTEVAIDGDSIDLEIRIFEGPQATIDKVVIAGNDRTHEHVIRRELRTRPGSKFSRSDIIRSQREIVNLGYFNPEALGINTPVNPNRGTVDIEYTVEEKPSDQLELSAGWGGFRRVIGTLGVSFNNFSLRNMFKGEAWRPLPQGDGQRLSIRAQTNGEFYQSYNVSLTEPWLGGRKPNAFTVAAFYNRFAFTGQSFDISQISVSLGTRLRWPDDNFVSSTAVNIQALNLNNWTNFRTDDGTIVNSGSFNNFSIKQTIARTTVSDPLFPASGSKISLSVQLTPPYSIFNRNANYAEQTPEERFRWLEYHKWRFDAEWYTTLAGGNDPSSNAGKLVLKAQAKIGILGFYNRDIGTSPFERFQVGGDGINNQQFGFAGVDIISLRGYEENQLEANLDPNGTSATVPTPVFDKFTLELRYPLSVNPSSTIYVLAFAQGGNTWRSLRDFNPFDLKRSVGMGLRVFLPMFGTIGFDYGLGFDKPGARTLNNLGDFNIVLGFEPE
ncbi:MAG: outer membrane protein assembly factor BamA [Saprospiraceae bacterium]|nr:outer membrane protein assembly factor BamA [Saprospiraceae bacterium]